MEDEVPNFEGYETLPDHESGVMRLISEAYGIPYRPLRSLEEAKSYPDGVVILEGDCGGQIYVVCPASVVSCSESVRQELLRDIDRYGWDMMEMALIYYERLSVGSRVAGGMGGGLVTEGVWVHDQLIRLRLEVAIEEVIKGRRSRIHDAA